MLAPRGPSTRSFVPNLQSMLPFLTSHRPAEIGAFAKEHPEVLSNVAVSAGSGERDLRSVEQALSYAPGINMICLDVANGYSEAFVKTVRIYRERFSDKVIMAGNVVTGEMVEELIISGADIVKVGIGPGSVCTTRKQTGVGYPQLSAVIECADAAHGLGGCKTLQEHSRSELLASKRLPLASHTFETDQLRHHRGRRLQSSRRPCESVWWRRRLCHARWNACRPRRKWGDPNREKW